MIEHDISDADADAEQISKWPVYAQVAYKQLKRSGYVETIKIDGPTVIVTFCGENDHVDGVTVFYNDDATRILIDSLNAMHDANIVLTVDLSRVQRWTQILGIAIHDFLIPDIHVQNAPHNVRDYDPVVIYCDSTLGEARNVLVQ